MPTTAKTFMVYIDRQTGTWGIATDLVMTTVAEHVVNSMEEMSDSELIQFAYVLEEKNRLES
jgi:hypothetical protein